MSEIKEKLLAVSEEKYAIFSSSLLNDEIKVIGVRLPILKKMAKAIENKEVFLSQASDDSFEEIMLQGFVIASLKCPKEKWLEEVWKYTLKITNWSLCDSFVSAIFHHPHITALWDEKARYLKSKLMWQQRFMLVCLIHWLNEHFEECLASSLAIQSDEYYVKMAQAWLYAEAASIDADTVFQSFDQMSPWVVNKTIQKINESNKIDAVIKKRARTYKRCVK